MLIAFTKIDIYLLCTKVQRSQNACNALKPSTHTHSINIQYVILLNNKIFGLNPSYSLKSLSNDMKISSERILLINLQQIAK